jgi:uncharacterized protein involved in response to NO
MMMMMMTVMMRDGTSHSGRLPRQNQAAFKHAVIISLVSASNASKV